MGELVDLAAVRAKRQPEKWVSKRAIAEHFGVTTRTVDRWRTLGMPSEKTYSNSPVRFRVSECERWAREQAA